MKISWKFVAMYGLLVGPMIAYINFRDDLTPGKIILGLIVGLMIGLLVKISIEKGAPFFLKKIGGKLLAQIKIEIREGEKLIKEGGANHFKRWEAVGGKLALTNKRLIFKSHKFNIQNHEQIFPFEKIRDLKENTSIESLKNVLMLELTNNEIHRFVVDIDSPSEWIKEIERQKASP
jgi:hypothetical protein